MKSILDQTFVYKPAHETDLRKRPDFARIIEANRRKHEPQIHVEPLVEHVTFVAPAGNVLYVQGKRGKHG